MTALPSRGRLHGRFRTRINREPSRILAAAMPWGSIALLSLLSASTLVLSAPLLPPVAFMALLAWRMLRPGMLPIWAGFPLGLVDDLYSGQPFGSAILLWSTTLLAMERIDTRLRWRGFLQDWLVAGALVAAYIAATAAIAGLAGAPVNIELLAPQLAVALVAHPLVTRLVAALDRIRLFPLKKTA